MSDMRFQYADRNYSHPVYGWLDKQTQLETYALRVLLRMHAGDDVRDSIELVVAEAARLESVKPTLEVALRTCAILHPKHSRQMDQTLAAYREALHG